MCATPEDPATCEVRFLSAKTFQKVQFMKFSRRSLAITNVVPDGFGKSLQKTTKNQRPAASSTFLEDYNKHGNELLDRNWWRNTGEVCHSRDEKVVYEIGIHAFFQKTKEMSPNCQPERLWQLLWGTLRVWFWLISLSEARQQMQRCIVKHRRNYGRRYKTNVWENWVQKFLPVVIVGIEIHVSRYDKCLDFNRD